MKVSAPIRVNAVALALMHEALTLRDTEEAADAATHLRRTVKAIE